MLRGGNSWIPPNLDIQPYLFVVVVVVVIVVVPATSKLPGVFDLFGGAVWGVLPRYFDLAGSRSFPSVSFVFL